ncbi:hypothetical protein EBESD8_15900 [Rhodococcus aetherivorans]|nr:hypothetical protein EBESD8_15900 [Rhodococcus aetherivorans]
MDLAPPPRPLPGGGGTAHPDGAGGRRSRSAAPTRFTARAIGEPAAELDDLHRQLLTPLQDPSRRGSPRAAVEATRLDRFCERVGAPTVVVGHCGKVLQEGVSSPSRGAPRPTVALEDDLPTPRWSDAAPCGPDDADAVCRPHLVRQLRLRHLQSDRRLPPPGLRRPDHRARRPIHRRARRRGTPVRQPRPADASVRRKGAGPGRVPAPGSASDALRYPVDGHERRRNRNSETGRRAAGSMSAPVVAAPRVLVVVGVGSGVSAPRGGCGEGCCR